MPKIGDARIRTRDFYHISLPQSEIEDIYAKVARYQLRHIPCLHCLLRKNAVFGVYTRIHEGCARELLTYAATAGYMLLSRFRCIGDMNV